MEANQGCFNDIGNGIHKKKKDDDESSEMESASFEVNQCTRNFKRSAEQEPVDDETVVVIKKRGNKVFIEI